MKNIYIIFIFIFILIFILIILYYYGLTNSLMVLSPSTNIGNMLSDYFYYKLTYNHRFTSLLLDPKNGNEINNFLKKVINHKTDIKIDIPYAKNNIISNKWLYKNSPGFEEFWKKARPIIKEIYMNSLPEININIPVVHFRCSDVPFIKNSDYHLPKMNYIYQIIDELQRRNYNNILFLNCFSHINKNNTICQKILNIYVNEFEKNGINVKFECGTIIEDFNKMVKCPFLISLNSSSFAFMAGISKDPINYMSNNMGEEINNEFIKQTEGDWIYSSYEPILHKDIKNYYDINELKRLMFLTD